MLDNIKNQINNLDREIQADKKGCHDYEEDLKRLNNRKLELQKEIKQNEEFIKVFDETMGPFMETYFLY